MSVEQNYVAIDLETTGLDAKLDKIIEVGAVRIVDGRKDGQYHSMINPHRKLEERIIKLTGITCEMVENAPDIGDILEEILGFCGDLPLLGHHVIFDYSFLKRAMVNHGFSFERKGIDTLKLCRRFMAVGESKSLEAACAFFCIERQQAHRALGDAWDAHYLYQKLAEEFGKQWSSDGYEREELQKDLEAFAAKPMIYKVKREQPATKMQKEDLRYLLKYHKIDLPVEIEFLSHNEVSRLKDKVISQFGRIR
ncbi:MAG: 3'-5' exonuclease [Lachnospiraceae bacterium]|jgi:DNA polymerase-3 subunit epsilon|nr:3'-5' exonuclease [Lachnospiraceae bacterium]